ncbi:MAG: hypothetical protein EWM48_02030 [Sphaerochaeta sp.]|nr:MAG: hypothetical protein EWM48_02030 [Sphaerochaeta sp.]
MPNVYVQTAFTQDNGETKVVLFEGQAAMVLVATDDGTGVAVNVATLGAYNGNIASALTESTIEALTKVTELLIGGKR